MGDFEFLTAGSVQHRDGWIVRNVGRALVEYQDGGTVASIQVERGASSSTIYPDTLKWTRMEGAELGPAEEQTVLSRIEDGLRALSGKDIERYPGCA